MTIYISSFMQYLFKYVAHFLLVIFERSLYILDTNLLSDMYVTNIFNLSIACISIFIKMIMEKQKFFFILKSNLSFFFKFNFLCASLRNLCWLYVHKGILKCLLLKTFMVLTFTFRSQTQFCVPYKEGVKVNFFHYVYSVSPAWFVEDISLFPLYYIDLFLENQLIV